MNQQRPGVLQQIDCRALAKVDGAIYLSEILKIHDGSNDA